MMWFAAGRDTRLRRCYNVCVVLNVFYFLFLSIWGIGRGSDLNGLIAKCHLTSETAHHCDNGSVALAAPISAVTKA